MLTTFLLSAVLQPQKKDYDPFMALGRMRSEFGEREVDVLYNGNSMEMWTWNNRRMMFEGSTVMLFPEGAYDRRIYLQEMSSVGEAWLAYETRTHEQVNGEHISFKWKIKLEPIKKGEPTPSGLGTLELMLRHEDLAVPKKIPKEAQSTLKAQKGFAAYNIAPAPGFAVFRFWYVKPDGSSTKGTFYEPPWPEYDSDWGYPETPFPYPVTDEEKAALTMQGWKFRLPWEKQ
jgi:hypothetical protein